MLNVLKRTELYLGFVAGIVTALIAIITNIPDYIPFSPPIITIEEENRVPPKWKKVNNDNWALVYKVTNYGGEPLLINDIIGSAQTTNSTPRQHNIKFDIVDLSSDASSILPITVKPGEEKTIAITLQDDIHRSVKAMIEDQAHTCAILFVYANKDAKGHNAASHCRTTDIRDMI